LSPGRGEVWKALVICNDPPYGTERSGNGPRLAGALARRDSMPVQVFLPGDAAGCAAAAQKVPGGYYNLERMIRQPAGLMACGSWTPADATG
jgi:uncharacterized protein involved in oxidation of intracellular sulfur